MNVLGYILEVFGVWLFYSAYKEATYPDVLEYTEKGKKYTARLRAFAIGIRVLLGSVSLLTGLWVVGAFR